jgi:hypothetical protein
MRRIKTLPLFAVVVAAVALALPAAAAAAPYWEHDDSYLRDSATVGLDGTINFETLGSGAACAASGELALSPGDQGAVTDLEIDVGSCEEFGFVETYCDVTDVEVETPMSVAADETGELTISGLSYTMQFDEGCPYPTTWSGEVGEVSASADDADAISALEVYGYGQGTIESFGTFGTLVYGDLDVSPAGEYGVGDSAAGTHWVDVETGPLSGPATVGLSGALVVDVLGSGVQCPLSGEATLYPGDEGEIADPAIDAEGCVGFGALETCVVVDAEVAPLWTLQATEAGEVDIGLAYTVYFDQGCSNQQYIGVASDAVTGTPDDPESIVGLGLAGPAQLNFSGTPFEQVIEGDVDIEGAQAGKYGIAVG